MPCHRYKQKHYVEIPHASCNMPIEEIQQILVKYGGQEDKIETLLEQRELEEKGFVTSKQNVQDTEQISFQEAKERNKQLLKDLETVKGNLRSKAIFSPSEMQWENITRNYRETPSLPVTTYRCHLPVFV